MRRPQPWPLLGLAIGLLSCASNTRIPAHIRAAIAAQYQGEVVALAQSQYYGPLYDENTKLLLSPYGFAYTTHIEDLNGQPIYPADQQGVVPAGAMFEIVDIEFPDIITLAGRMLTTPRYNPWVILRPSWATARATEQGPEKALDPIVGTLWRRASKPFILVLPADLHTEEQVRAALSRVLVSPQKMANWLAQRRPQIRAAIRHKELVVGMGTEEMVASRGLPIHWIKNPEAATGEGGSPSKTAWFGEIEAQVLGGKITAVRRGRGGCTPTRPCR